jgi:hypothetical protein
MGSGKQGLVALRLFPRPELLSDSQKSPSLNRGKMKISRTALKELITDF